MKKTLAPLVIALALLVGSVFAVTATGAPAPKPTHYVACGPSCGDGSWGPPPNSTCTKFSSGAYQYYPYPYLYYCVAGLVGPGVWQWVGIIY
jgi:hypothetical protein